MASEWEDEGRLRSLLSKEFVRSTKESERQR
jgi:hypothetical protein